MNRLVVAGLFGLAVAGCAIDRNGASRSRGPIPTVEMTPPIPSIHEAINRENPGVDPNSVRVGHPAEVAERTSPRSVAKSAAGAVPDPGELAVNSPAEPNEPKAAEASAESGTVAELAPAVEAAQEPTPAPAAEPEAPKSPGGDPMTAPVVDEPKAATDTRVPIILPSQGSTGAPGTPGTEPTGTIPRAPVPAAEPGPAAAPVAAPSKDPAADRDPLLAPGSIMLQRQVEILLRTFASYMSRPQCEVFFSLVVNAQLRLGSPRR